MALGIDHLDAYGLFLRAAKFEERIHRACAAAALGAGQIQRGLLDEGHEDRMKRKIVGEIVKAGSEEQNIALADFLFEKHRRAVRKVSDDARAARIHAHREIKFYAS